MIASMNSFNCGNNKLERERPYLGAACALLSYSATDGQKGMNAMRKYTLASKDAKTTVDLRDYRQVIEDAVHEVLPAAKVQVESDYYTVSPTPKQGNAVRIGRATCKSKLKKHCVQIPKLFSSAEVDEVKEETNDRESEQQYHGGHF